MIHAFLRCIGGTAVALTEIVRVPLFLLHRRKIFQNEFVYVFYHPSFGHAVTELDYLSRLYYPHRISVVFLAHPNTNPYLLRCFSHNLDGFVYTQAWGRYDALFTMVSYHVMRWFLLVIAGISRSLHVIDRPMIYRTLSVVSGKLFLGREETATVERDDDYTGYFHLIDEGIGKAPALPTALLDQCRTAIMKAAPRFFEKPLVTLLLREKGNGKDLATFCRSCGPQENYRDAVSFLGEHGYHIAGTGETKSNVFRGIPGYFDLSAIPLSPQLLNIFLLTQCVLFIGQMSGAYLLPSSCGIPCLIADAMTHRLGTFRRENLVLYKNLRHRGTGKYLSLVEVFRDHKDLAFGYHFSEKNIEIMPNTQEEILEATKECIAIVEHRLVLTEEDRQLIERFRQLPSEGMHLAFQGNRTSLHILRSLKHLLL